MKYLLLSIFSLFLFVFSNAQKDNIELTEDDITNYPQLNADKISVYGIRLGMKQEEVKKILDDNKTILYKDDPQKTDIRIYVYYKTDIGMRGSTILYLIWKDGSKELTHIVVYKDLSDKMKGETKKLFEQDAVNPDSELFKNYLGSSDGEMVTLDIPSIQSKITEYYHNAKGIKIIMNKYGEETKYFFGFYKPQ